MKKLLFIILNIVATLALHAEGKDIDSYIPINKVQNLNTFVVIISNENYKYEEAVPYALNDGSTFRLYCEKTLGIPEKNIKYVPDASLNDMKYFLSWLERVMKAYDGSARAIFYYSGHGMPDDANRQAFLLPVDGHSISPESGLSTETLYARLGALQSASTVVLLDACFSGACRDGGMMQSARSVVIAPKKDAVSGNMVVFSAAKGNETAYPYRDKKHGMFTYFFLEKLNEMGGCVNLGELSDYVRAKVSQMSVIENEKSQTPTVLASTGNTSWRTWKLAEKPATTYENIPRNMVKPQDEESGSLSVNTSGATKNTSRKNRLALADGKITVNGVTYEMVRIDKGTFSMGSSAKLNSRSTFSMDMPRHSVTLNAYAIGKTEVPQAIWEAIMHDNPSENKGSRLPVVNARINVLRKIIYDGVVDFNGGMPLVRIGTDTGQNPWLKNLFDGKVATYKTFLGGVELVGDFDRDASTYICKANVVVKHSFLKRQIDMQVNGAIENPSPEINYQRQASTHRWSVQ